ncbi:unnamed protein product [Schistosoma margrebowiei]|uniref:Uncharacterized protein n=1 Tax=Schistosoma margrebowiei TaxID=48269 RepID=A0A183LPZ6_9TREM|nr:unnamed protein product [Schistosoma margrebowiei]
MFKSNLNNQSIIGFNFQMNQYDNEKVFIFQPNNNNNHNNLYQLQTGLFHLYLNKQSIIDLDITQSINKTIKMIKPNIEKINTNKINKNVTITDNKSMNLINKPMNLLDDIYKEKLNEIGYRIHELKFTCIFRICKQLAWCSWMQTKTASVAAVSAPVGLNIHKGKTKDFKFKAENSNPLTLDGETLEDVESFTYLGSIIDEQAGSDANVKARIGKARAAFLQLKNIWNSKKLSTNIKPSACDSTISSLNNPRITFLPPSLRIIQRSIPLYLIESIPSSQLPVKKQVGILTCLMGIMGMLLARKYRHHLNQTRNSLIQSKSIIIKQNHCTQHIETDKNYYNPIKQSSISQSIIHKPHYQLDQQIDNEILKSLLTVDNHITNNNTSSSVSNTSSNSNSNSSNNNNNQPYTMDIKDCCKYWLNEHSYANPLLLQRSLPHDLPLHQHHPRHRHHIHSQQQQQQQQPYQQHQVYHSQCQQHQQPSQYQLQHYQISPSSTVATPTHCSCLNETLFTDNKLIQNLSNYYTLKGYTTLPITTSNTFTSFKSIENSKQNDDYPLMNRTTTAFILEPTHTMINSINSSNTTTTTTTIITTASNNDTHNHGNNNNVSVSTMSNNHELITSSYPTTNISNNNNNNNSVIYCSDQLTDSYPHSSIQLQDDVILFQNNNNNSTNEPTNNQWCTIKNVQFINNKSNHLSLQSQYKKLSTFDDTIYFGIDYHNPNCTINPIIETIQLDTSELQHNQIQS